MLHIFLIVVLSVAIIPLFHVIAPADDIFPPSEAQHYTHASDQSDQLIIDTGKLSISSASNDVLDHHELRPTITANGTNTVDVISETGSNTIDHVIKEVKAAPDISSFDYAVSHTIPVYTKEMARSAIRQSPWECSINNTDPAYIHSNHGTMFAFVHVYKAAGTSMRLFFNELAYTCHKTYISLAKCTGVLPSSIKSQDPWQPCRIEEVADGRSQQKQQYMYPTGKNYVRTNRQVSNPDLRAFFDLYVGHARIGTGDFIFGTPGSVRYIVFLRDPIERHVSGVLYQNKVKGRNETLEQVVRKIKDGIKNRREVDDYADKSLSYLLTPSQRVVNSHVSFEELRASKTTIISSSNMTFSSFKAESRAKLAIQNLYQYNAIIGMTERMSDSLRILRHVFLQNVPENALKDKAEEVFKKYGLSTTTPGSDRLGNSSAASIIQVVKQANKSRGKVSTSAVIAELAKDEEHMELFNEYVKYERLITEFAWKMHHLQFDAVMERER